MPFIHVPGTVGKKRKRVVGGGKEELGSTDQKRIKSLEAGIIESRTNYNNIVQLQQLADDESNPEARAAAAVALCRVFCVLLAGGNMTRSKNTGQSEWMLVDWLKEQYTTFCGLLLSLVQNADDPAQEMAINLILKLVKEESRGSRSEHVWRHGLFRQLIETMIGGEGRTNVVQQLFVRDYLNEYDDIRYYAFYAIATQGNDDLPASGSQETKLDMSNKHRLALLLAIEPPAEQQEASFYGQAPESKKHALHSLAKHKKQAQEAWVNVLKSQPSDSQRKEILSVLTRRVAPWFLQVDMLADFLTDSYSAGGATSLLALSGIYHLIQERNLDYPSFYVKLYSLLDEGLLHSKHRSRFFRHLEVFMSSSHLPAALVASFMKRLARLSLSAPPAGIIAVCPWIYNMLKAHPQCTFTIHRETHDRDLRKQLEEQGMDDPFDMEESDPMMTGAIDSSLWEIETLQSHYHPNVASLAKIISEQFTKQAYKMEDFLDYSYANVSAVCPRHAQDVLTNADRGCGSWEAAKEHPSHRVADTKAHFYVRRRRLEPTWYLA